MTEEQKETLKTMIRNGYLLKYTESNIEEMTKEDLFELMKACYFTMIDYAITHDRFLEGCQKICDKL